MPTNINFVGSSLTECIIVRMFSSILAKIDERKARKSELATFDENRRAVGMLNPMRDKKNESTCGGGRRDDTCDHGLSIRPLRVNLLRVTW